jgi:hypothetical protein
VLFFVLNLIKPYLITMIAAFGVKVDGKGSENLFYLKNKE